MRYDGEKGNGTEREVGELLGKTLKKIIVDEDENEIVFITKDKKTYRFCHLQDCCENVVIEDIAGDLQDLIGSPLTMAEVVSNHSAIEDDDIWDDSQTWTFYKFATINGYVTIRWYGSSNGYYSEEVNFRRIATPVNIIRIVQVKKV